MHEIVSLYLSFMRRRSPETAVFRRFSLSYALYIGFCNVLRVQARNGLDICLPPKTNGSVIASCVASAPTTVAEVLSKTR